MKMISKVLRCRIGKKELCSLKSVMCLLSSPPTFYGKTSFRLILLFSLYTLAGFPSSQSTFSVSCRAVVLFLLEIFFFFAFSRLTFLFLVFLCLSFCKLMESILAFISPLFLLLLLFLTKPLEKWMGNVCMCLSPISVHSSDLWAMLEGWWLLSSAVFSDRRVGRTWGLWFVLWISRNTRQGSRCQP